MALNTECVVVTYGGLAGEILPESEKVVSWTPVQIINHISATTLPYKPGSYSAATSGFLKFMAVVMLLVCPICCGITFTCLWMLPLRPPTQHRLSTIGELFYSWSIHDISFISY